MRETRMSLDPSRPLPRDVLRTLSDGLEFENTLLDLCKKAENVSSQDIPLEEAEKFVHSIRSLTEVGTLVELGEHVSPNKERSRIGATCKEDDDEIPSEGRDACPDIMPVNEGMLASEVIETSDPKVVDEEDLGLLRWLASSQAAEDLCTDDELVHESILSPLLPTKSIDKILEKANLDYESESQQECQDILDSVEDVVIFEKLKERAACSTDHNHLPQTLSENIIPQVDGLFDDQFTSPRASNSSERQMNSELERFSPDRVLHDTGIHLIGERRRHRPLWGSLPFSTQQNVTDDLQSSNINLTGICGNEMQDIASTGSLAGDEVGKYFNASVTNADTDSCGLKDGSTLTGCSVRDLMRRKRSYRVEPSEHGTCRVKKAIPERGQKEETLCCPKRLEFHTLQNDKQAMMLTETPNTKPLAFGQEEKVCERGSSGTACPPESVNEGLEQGNTVWSGCLTTSIEHERLFKDIHINRKGHEGSTAMEWVPQMCLENLGDTNTATDEINPQIENCGTGEEDKHTCLSGTDNSLPTVVDTEKGHMEYIEMAFSRKAPTIDWKGGMSEDALLAPSLYDHAFLGGMENYEEMFGCNSNILDVRGTDRDELLPFFVDNYKELKEVNKKSYKNTELNFHQETVLGVPTHYQNDGSFVYLLTPIFSPPSVDCVDKWLLHDVKGISRENFHAAMLEPSSPKPKNLSDLASVKNKPLNFGKASSKPQDLHVVSSGHQINSQDLLADACGETLPESLCVSHMKPILDQLSQEKHGKLNTDLELQHTVMTTELQCEGTNSKGKDCTESWQDISQISGPHTKSKLTPLSQIGFRDSATVGAGQQLTLLSVEVLTESRGNLRPDPRFDAVNVIALVVQEDNDDTVDVFVLLRTYDGESCQRNLDGISGCKMVVTFEEKHLFNHFIQIICSLDPDILLGWEIQGGSLGFLAERAAHLGIGLLNKISRTPTSETKIAAKDSANPVKAMPDNLLPESLVADSVVLEDAIIEDEWGRTHASGVHVGGRIVLNIWRLMRGEIKLNMYTMESVAEAVLRRKIPSLPCRTLTQWFSSGPSRARFRCIEYVIERSKLNLEIMNQLDMINRTSELARVFGIDFFSVLSRGSQYRVESMFLRLAHTQNYLAISPGNQQVASQPAMECLPLVMEPESGFYADPVVVLDFQSLYPSMIIAYNLCFCTCLGKVIPSKVNTLGVSSFSPDPQLLMDLKHQILLTPNGVMYVPSKVRKGVLPRLLEEILSTRIMVKQTMKKLTPSQRVLYRIFNARQLALKLIANVTYGYTAAGFSGRMPCAELADSIVQCGRRTLESAISFVNAHDKWNARVIYGDTDSMFVLLKGRTVKESFKIGQEIASAITAMNPNPVNLKMEKVYHPCFLITKKRYVGYSYESPDQPEPTFDAKGIETVRRDTCGAVAKTLEQSLRLFFENQDISKVKLYLQRQWTRILCGRVSLQDFVFAKEVRLGTYSSRASSLPPAAIVATKAMRTDPRAEPRYAERIPYVVIYGEPGARLVDMVVDPLDLLGIDSPFRLNDLYYIHKQIIPALQRLFGLLGADLNHWFLDMPRPVRPTLAKRPSHTTNPYRTRIDYYYLSKHCIVCGDLVQASNRLCNNCFKEGPAVATTVIGRTSKLERDIRHLADICRHCGGGDWIVESGVKCTSLACAVFYERRKVQKELQALSDVAMEAGFYPRCMVEWF